MGLGGADLKKMKNKVIQQCVNSNISKALDILIAEKSSQINGNVATNNTASSTGILSQKLSFLINSPKVVKSIQRGKLDLGFTGYYKDVTISAITVNKSIMRTASKSQHSTGLWFQTSSSYVFEIINSTTIRIFKADTAANSGFYLMWEVIEFY